MAVFAAVLVDFVAWLVGGVAECESLKSGNKVGVCTSGRARRITSGNRKDS